MSAVIARSVKATAWPEVSLNELVGKNGLFCDGDWVESKDQDPNGDVRLIQLADIGDGSYRNRSSRFLTSSKAEELRCTLLKQGDVLVARMPEPLGRACIFPGDEKPAVTVVDVAIIRPSSKDVDSRWLMHALNSPETRAEIAGLEAGTTRKRISRKNLATITLRLPPLDEQRRIVAEIEEQLSRIEAGVAALKRVQANLKRYRAAVLAAACDGSLVGLNSSEWPRHTLGEIATTVRNGFAGKPDAEQGTRIFRISAVRPLSLNVEDVRYLSMPITAYGESYVRPDDVLFTRYNGSRDLVGACAVVPSGIPPTVHPDKLIRVRVPAEILSPSMLALLASAGEGRSFLESRIRTTAGQSGISGSDLKALPLRLPSQNEQALITAELDRRLSVVEELETQVRADLARAERLRQSALARAFSIEK